MDERALAKIEAWLNYFEDLGIGTFYRSRKLTAPRGTPEAERPLGEPEATSRPALISRQAIAAAPAASRERRAAAAQPKAASLAPAPLPVFAPPSLFETARHVENDTLERIRADIGDCTRCKLHRSRSHIVFGDGNAGARLVFVGEGPGEEEDRQGLPFVGRAGKLLTQMIEAMGLKREEVYIANVVKCRPPQNRTPERDETETCGPFLERQLAVIAPAVIVSLGNVATQELLGTTEPMARLRGQWFQVRGAKLLPTYHPAYLLRNPSAKGVVWEDLQKVMAELGLNPPQKSTGKSSE